MAEHMLTTGPRIGGRFGTGEDALVGELLERCLPLLSERGWSDRLRALMQLHDQLRDDVQDIAVFCHIFPRFIEQIIERLGASAISSLEQAQIYANSADATHRDMAGQWLKQHYARNKINA